MDSSDLTIDQLDALFDRIQPMNFYLTKLANRCHENAWPADDELRQKIDAAATAVHALAMAVHYASCRHQTGGK